MNLAWSHIQAIGGNEYLTNTDFIGAGLAYHFG